ncbi:MAG: hypothetical protein ABGW97_16010 [Christiangramia sp.]|uniref:hypothetical protein n=1 Tax=Christiangramia sp. TaxID=1931228 RepID=UPI003242FB8B
MGKLTPEQQAKKYLKDNKAVKKIHATSDGFLFLHKPDAVSHGKKLEDKNVTTFSRSAKVDAPAKDEEPKGFLDQSVAKIKAALAAKEDVAELEGYLEQEKAQEEPRTTAVEAIESRIAELTKED